jgi:putative tryptophan/tyrosine transport system substrate-binding protein
MKRREFIKLLGGAAISYPIAVRGQQAAMPVIGFLSSRTPAEDVANLVPFRQGLKDTGYVEGRNVTIEYRWAEDQYDQLPALAAEMVRLPATVIVSIGGIPGARAAKGATTTIPIVFQTGADPVAFGLVASLNKPGGNITGATSLVDEVGPKRLEVMHELLPIATNYALLVNPTNPNSETQSKQIQAAAGVLGLKLNVLRASKQDDFDAVFATAAQLATAVLVIGPDTFYSSPGPSAALADLAARHAMPTISFTPNFPAAGGLMSYGGDSRASLYTVGVYTGRILKGEKPAELPVQESAKVQFVINLKTAKTLGITIPITLLGRADQVIE